MPAGTIAMMRRRRWHGGRMCGGSGRIMFLNLFRGMSLAGTPCFLSSLAWRRKHTVPASRNSPRFGNVWPRILTRPRTSPPRPTSTSELTFALLTPAHSCRLPPSGRLIAPELLRAEDRISSLTSAILRRIYHYGRFPPDPKTASRPQSAQAILFYCGAEAKGINQNARFHLASGFHRAGRNSGRAFFSFFRLSFRRGG